jgi:ABC-type microcin C transport system permease subunit YejB
MMDYLKFLMLTVITLLVGGFCAVTVLVAVTWWRDAHSRDE